MERVSFLPMLKLYPELVPKTLWGKSLSKTRNDTWKYISSRTRETSGFRCSVCGKDVGGVRESVCHELWCYDDVSHVQTLMGFQTVCQDCNSIKHFGHFRIMLATGRISVGDYNRVIKHALKVNDCSEKVFFSVVDRVFSVWEKRSKVGWTQDLSLVDKYREERKELRVWMKSHPEEVKRIMEKNL